LPPVTRAALPSRIFMRGTPRGRGPGSGYGGLGGWGDRAGKPLAWRRRLVARESFDDRFDSVGDDQHLEVRELQEAFHRHPIEEAEQAVEVAVDVVQRAGLRDGRAAPRSRPRR